MREYLQLTGTSLCAIQITPVVKHNLRELREAIVIQHAATWNSKWSRILSRARRWIHAVGHAFTDEYRNYRRLFFNRHKRERTDNKIIMRLNTNYFMLYVLIFNKPFLANFVNSKNVYTCLNACIFLNMASKCAWRISKFKLDIAECQ
jgi:hypothetical protein